MKPGYQRVIDWIDDRIVNSPGRVIVLFLVLTGVFAVGLGNVSTESGTEQFAEDIPAANALDNINQEFGPSFEEDIGSTQLIQRAPNVLSKPELVRMLRAQERLAEREDLRVVETSSAASIVARQLDPTAVTVEQQRMAVEAATPTQIDRAVRAAADNPRFSGTLSNDFNPTSATASATVGVVRHRLPAGLSDEAGQGGTSPMTPIQLEAQRVVSTVGGDITVFGDGIISDEFGQVIGDSLLIVTPAAAIFIVFFLVVAYRDLLDLLLGTFALVMAIVWTFGFIGLAGIPFNTIMISVPPLMLAIGIDYGIHAINRYREARQEIEDIGAAMRVTTDQLLVAFAIVTGTTVVGFLSNFASDLLPIRDFGLTAAVGIVFISLIFGVFIPAAKVWLDRRRDRIPIPTFSQKPLGGEGSRLGGVLHVGVSLAERAPAIVLALALLATAGAGFYATGVDTNFSQEDFLPPEETPAYLEALPEPFKPGDYSAVADINFLEAKFETTQGQEVLIYVTGRLENDAALEEIYRAGEDPPSTFVSENRRADSTSIITVIQAHAEEDPEFRRLVERNDRNDNGVPDDNLDQIYDSLMTSPAREQAREYLAADRRSTRVQYAVKADATDAEVEVDGRQVADRFRMGATATGSIVVFQAISDLILESAITSLVIALSVTAVFLLLVYWVLEDLATLAFANLVPIVITVALIAASMRLIGISFNALTATILALTIGLGIDYSVHIVHRFIDERRHHDLSDALNRTVRGTGGALLGSMLTTTFGIGVLVLSILSVLGQFGILTALSIVYSFVASILVLPSALVLWDRGVGNDPDVPIGSPDEPGPGGSTPAVHTVRRGGPSVDLSPGRAGGTFRFGESDDERTANSRADEDGETSDESREPREPQDETGESHETRREASDQTEAIDDTSGETSEIDEPRTREEGEAGEDDRTTGGSP